MLEEKGRSVLHWDAAQPAIVWGQHDDSVVVDAALLVSVKDFQISVVHISEEVEDSDKNLPHA